MVFHTHGGRLESGRARGGVDNISAVGAGRDGVADRVADDIVVTVLVSGKDDELGSSELGDEKINKETTSVPAVRFTGMSLPKTPQGWSVKARLLGLSSESTRARVARLPVTRMKFSCGMTSMWVAAPGR